MQAAASVGFVFLEAANDSTVLSKTARSSRYRYRGHSKLLDILRSPTSHAFQSPMSWAPSPFECPSVLQARVLTQDVRVLRGTGARGWVDHEDSGQGAGFREMLKEIIRPGTRATLFFSRLGRFPSKTFTGECPSTGSRKAGAYESPAAYISCTLRMTRNHRVMLKC